MAFHVEFTRRALRDMHDLYGAINAEHSPAAARWFNGLEKTILGLEEPQLVRILTIRHGRQLPPKSYRS